MTPLEKRIETCRAYRNEALEDPITNKLYIQDLDEMIRALMSQLPAKPIMRSGWIDNG